ncbi:MAG: group III truncated hemoglobin [Phormidesmis sp. FL-bin-119]|nr:group III truncated hemoglobin [Pedobacter sp.]
MKTDIQGRKDIELLVNTFYDKVLKDKKLACIFVDLTAVNLSYHLPVMYDFWENIILRRGAYEGNPMHLHRHLHHLTPLNEGHFRQWNKLFVLTIDELFEGNNASLAKERALSISAILRQRVLTNRKN